MSILLLLIWMVTVACGMRTCPNLQPVPIDEEFLFTKQPEGGFYATYSSGENSVPEYVPRPLNKGIKGNRKMCVRFKLMISGEELSTAPRMECNSKSSLSAMYCEVAEGPALTEAAISAQGVRIPKFGISVITDTDNKTFVAFGVCIDGALYEWAVFTTQPENKIFLARTAKSLFVSTEEVMESHRKKVKTGRTKFRKGPCQGRDGVAAEVGAVEDGLSGLFG